MLLLDRNGAKQDRFALVVEGEERPEGRALIVPLSGLEAALAAGEAPLGALVENSVKLSALEPYFAKLALIVIRFPSSADGRGFSLARQLRQKGFTGTLRASGPLFSDQFPQALACGFDEVEIPDANAARQPVEQWLAARDRITIAYQHAHGLGASIVEQRKARRSTENLAGEKNV
jgi:uncharacterized protein (DUF934 family)